MKVFILVVLLCALCPLLAFGDEDASIAADTLSYPIHPDGTLDIEDQSHNDRNGIRFLVPSTGTLYYPDYFMQIQWIDDVQGPIELKVINADIEYSIGIFAENVQSYRWTIPIELPAASNYRLQASSVRDPGIFGQSSFTFKIYDGLKFIPHNGYLTCGAPFLIQWQKNFSAPISLYFMQSWDDITLLSPEPISENSFFWIVPMTLLDRTYKFVAFREDIPGAHYVSGIFYASSYLYYTSPVGSETYLPGSSCTITWYSNAWNMMTLDLYDGDNLVSNIAHIPTWPHEYTWHVPYWIPAGTNYRFKIDTQQFPNEPYFSETFTIQKGINMLTPNHGAYLPGQQVEINWEENFPEPVHIAMYSSEGFYRSLGTISGDTTSFSHRIDYSIPEGQSYKYIVASVADYSVYDISSEFLSVMPKIRLSLPTSSSFLQTGQSFDIVWEDNISGPVSISLVKKNGGQIVISDATESSGVYSWNIPDDLPPADGYHIVIQSTTDASIASYSQIFAIHGTINVSSPNGAETILSGSIYPIQWTQNIGTNVNIALINQFGIPVSIVENLESTGTYDWYVDPLIQPGNAYKISISNARDTRICDVSDAPFTIRAFINVVNPSNATVLAAGENVLISWASGGIISDVKIDYSIDAGLTWQEIAANAANSGTYHWTVPAVNSSKCKLRIQETGSPMEAISEGLFTIIDYPEAHIFSHVFDLPYDNPANGYRMVGIPGISDLALSSLLAGTPHQDWEAYDVNSLSDNTLIPYDGSWRFGIGKAYWILSNAPVHLEDVINPAYLINNSYTNIPLHQGWNLISNPFEKEIRWENVMNLNAISDPIWTFKGSYTEARELKAFEGYYFYNRKSLSNLKIPWFDVDPDTSNQSEHQCAVAITLISKDDLQSRVQIALDADSSMDFDDKDQLAPPLDFGELRLEIINTNLDSGFTALSKEVRPLNGTGTIFDLRGNAPAASGAYLELSRLTDDHYNVLLHDLRNHRYVNLSKVSSYALNANHDSYQLKVIVGDNSFIDEYVQNTEIKDFRVFSNYPNPFNPKTSFRFSSPEPALATIKIYNTRGQLIDTLSDNALYTEGFHEVYWNAASNPSGIYIARIELKGASRSLKKILKVNLMK